jgi:hypothetical protein
MVSSIASMSKSTPSIRSIIEHIIESGQMNRQEYLQLSSAVLSDQRMTDDDRRQINRIFDYIQVGRLKLVN